MSSEAPVLLSQVNPSISVLSLNRPDRCNSFSMPLLESLSEILRELETNRENRVLIITGTGNSFCGGLDLAEASRNAENAKLMTVYVLDILFRIRSSHAVTIAAANGSAYGGGAGIVAACDLVIAGENLKLAFPEVRRGLKPSLLFPLLKRKLSRAAVAELALLGEAIDANRARDLGLVQGVSKPEETLKNAIELAERICLGERKAVEAAKRMIFEAYDTMTLIDEMLDAIERHHDSWTSPEAMEGISAFLEKRQPNW